MKRLLVLLAACGGGGNGGGVDAPDTQGQANIGSFFIDSYTSGGMPTAAGEADLGFFTGFPACTSVTTVGPCEVSDCTMETQQTPHSAGTVTVNGPSTHFSFKPGGSGEYAPIQAQGVLFNGGDSLTIAAPGADVPAFSQSISTPSKSTITSPAKPSSPYLPITRASGLTVTWTGVTTGTQAVSLDDGGYQVIRLMLCRFDASAGTGMIPADALMTLRSSQGHFAMATITETSVDAGDFRVGLEARWDAVWPDDTLVSGQTMIQ